jgi:hypothetical protein
MTDSRSRGLIVPKYASGQQEHVPAGGRQFPAIQLLYALDFCFSSLFIPVSGIERVFFCPFESRYRGAQKIRK